MDYKELLKVKKKIKNSNHYQTIRVENNWMDFRYCAKIDGLTINY